jgi:hypothetical protein
MLEGQYSNAVDVFAFISAASHLPPKSAASTPTTSSGWSRSVAKKTLKSPAVRRPSQGCEDRAQPLQDDARALPSVSSMRRRMVPAQRPHWALQPRQP